MRATSKIVGMKGEWKANLFARGARMHLKGRYVATIALASLARSHEYLDLGFESVQDLAAAKSNLEAWEVSQMLWVGKALLNRPELDDAFRNDVLSWSKVKALVAHVNKDNVKKWIKKASNMSSNALEHELAKLRDPIVGERMVPMYVSEHAQAWFQELLAKKQAEQGEKNLNTGEFFYRMLDLMQAAMEDPATALPPTKPVLPVPHWPGRSRHIPVPVQTAALRRARFCCELCGNRLGLVFHHAVIPFAEGGPHTLANIQVWCGRCHDQKHKDQRCGQSAEAASPQVAQVAGGGSVPAADQSLPADCEDCEEKSETDEPVLEQPLPLRCDEVTERAEPVLEQPSPVRCDVVAGRDVPSPVAAEETRTEAAPASSDEGTDGRTDGIPVGERDGPDEEASGDPSGTPETPGCCPIARDPDDAARAAGARTPGESGESREVWETRSAEETVGDVRGCHHPPPDARRLAALRPERARP